MNIDELSIIFREDISVTLQAARVGYPFRCIHSHGYMIARVIEHLAVGKVFIDVFYSVVCFTP